jgi:hypothetical protein
MSTEHILALLIQERDRLNRAIEALQGGARRRGRPPKNSLSAGWVSSGDPLHQPKKRKPFSAATKRKMAAAQKKRWAALKSSK